MDKYIDHADGKQVQAMFSFMENKTGDGKHFYDDETVIMLEERKAAYLKSNKKGFTVNESME